MTTWCVTSTVRAPLMYLRRFVDHYVALGAHRIYFFHDDPSFASVVEHPKVKNVICDDEFWQGKRPDEHRTRQRSNATRAFKWTDADWLLHCDHDELILSDRSVSELLASLGDDILSVMAPPIEAIYDAEPTTETCYDTSWFKHPMKAAEGVHPVLLRCFGDVAHLMKQGFTGHLEGKSFTRRGPYSVRIPIHVHEVAPEGMVAKVTAPGLAIMHFDGLTFADWHEKNVRRMTKQITSVRVPKLRMRQWNAVAEARDQGGDEALHQLYLRLKVLSAEKIIMAQKERFIQFVER